MSIADKLKLIAQNMQKVYEYGISMGYDMGLSTGYYNGFQEGNKLLKLLKGETTMITAEDLEGLSAIPNYGFCAWKLPTHITLPDGVRSIGANAFQGCTNLKYIKIPSAVTNIKDSTFSSCSALESIDFSESKTVPVLLNVNAFLNVPTTCEVLVPSDLYDEWIAAENWSELSVDFVKYGEAIGGGDIGPEITDPVDPPIIDW